MDEERNIAALENLREVVPMGGAVCLMGAGFSTTATDQKGKAVPNTSDLIREIKIGVNIDLGSGPINFLPRRALV